MQYLLDIDAPASRAAALLCAALLFASCQSETVAPDATVLTDEGAEPTCATAADCDSGELCLDLQCTACAADWQCEAVQGIYGPGFMCLEGACVPRDPCENPVLGCPCDPTDGGGPQCATGLVCDAEFALCRQERDCDVFACALHQRCEPAEDGQDAACVDACEFGYMWDEETQTCPPEPTCDEDAPGSIVEECAEQHRECDDFGKHAVCGECVEGARLASGPDTVEGECVPLVTCEDLDCDGTERRQCTPHTEETDAECGACLPGLEEVGDACVATCASLSCAGLGKACDDGGADATCTSCLPGYDPGPNDTCLPPDPCIACAEAHKACIGTGQDATCGPCLTGYKASGDDCVALKTCASLGCASLGKSCTPATAVADAQCGPCLDGYVELGGNCVYLETCGDLGCAGLFRECTPGTPGVSSALCAGCLPGYIEKGNPECDPILTCEALGCDAAKKNCQAETDESDAECTDCLPFYLLVGEVCTAVQTCQTLGCEGKHRTCIPQTATANASCGACVDDYEEVNGTCQPIDYCLALGCAANNRACTKPTGGQVAECGACLPGYLPQGETCVKQLHCSDLTCLAEHRTCIPATETASAKCGGCLADYIPDGDQCILSTKCAQLGCASQNKLCIEATATTHAVCGGCEPGTIANANDNCVPIVTCDDLDCDAEGKLCAEASGTTHAFCTVCEPGFVETEDDCVAVLTCEDLDCGALLKACVPSTDSAHARCEGCADGTVDDGTGLCVTATTCADLGYCDETVEKCHPAVGGNHAYCEGCQDHAVELLDGTCGVINCLKAGAASMLGECNDLFRECLSDDTGAECGECFVGYRENASGDCVPVKTCQDLPCANNNKLCIPAGAHEDATCGGCIGGYYLPLNSQSCEPDGNATCKTNVTPPTISILDQCASVFKRCETPEGTDNNAFCGECLDGYVADPFTGKCFPLLTCEQLDCEGIENKHCEDDPENGGRCTGCLEGFVFDQSTGLCNPAKVCADLDCAGKGLSCKPQTGNEDAYCHPTCEDGKVWTPSGCHFCPPCPAQGTTGEYYPDLTTKGDCICTTLPGWFYSASGDISTFRCDTDGDGWVRETARQSMESPDPVIRANARCDVGRIGSVVLTNWAGQTKVEDLTGSFEFGLPLYETDRNDVQSALDQANLPAYGATYGRRLRATELNRLTKYCVAGADFNDNRREDASEWDNPILPPGFDEKLRPFNTYSYFAELHEGWYEAPAEGETLGSFHIREKSRLIDPARDHQNFVPNGAFDAPGTPTLGWAEVGTVTMNGTLPGGPAFEGTAVILNTGAWADEEVPEVMGVVTEAPIYDGDRLVKAGAEVQVRISFYASAETDLIVDWDGTTIHSGGGYEADRWHHVRLLHTVSGGGPTPLLIGTTTQNMTMYLDSVRMLYRRGNDLPVRYRQSDGTDWQQCIALKDQTDFDGTGLPPQGMDLAESYSIPPLYEFDFNRPTNNGDWTVPLPLTASEPYAPIQGMTHHSQFKCVKMVDDGTTTVLPNDLPANPGTFQEYEVNTCYALAHDAGDVGDDENSSPAVVECTPVSELGEKDCAKLSGTTWDGQCTITGGGHTGWAAVRYAPGTDETNYTHGCANQCAQTRARCGVCGMGSWMCDDATRCGLGGVWECADRGFGTVGTCDQVSLPPLMEGDTELINCDEASVGRTFYYVAPNAPVGGDGTRAAPYGDIQSAIDAAYAAKAHDQDLKVVIAAAGTHEGPIHMRDGVSVYGGYVYYSDLAGVPADFVYAPDSVTVLTNDTPEDGVLYVVKAEGVEQQSLLQNLTVTTPDAGAEVDVRAIWAARAPGLFLRDLVVEPGAGKSSIGLFSDYSNFLTIENSRIVGGDALGEASEDGQVCDGCSMAVFCPDMSGLENPCLDKAGCTGLTMIGQDSEFWGSEKAAKTGQVAPTCVSYPHRSCLDIKNALQDVKSGVYFIDPDGPGVFPEVEVYCDMDYGFGGWTYALWNDEQPPNTDVGHLFEHYLGLRFQCKQQGMELVDVKSAAQLHQSLRPYLEDVVGLDLTTYGGVPLAYSYDGDNAYMRPSEWNSKESFEPILSEAAATYGYTGDWETSEPGQKCAGFGYSETGGISDWDCHTYGVPWDAECVTSACGAEEEACAQNEDCAAAWFDCTQPCDSGACIEACAGSLLEGSEAAARYQALLACGGTNSCVAQFTLGVVCSTNDKESPLYYGQSPEMPGESCYDIREKSGWTEYKTYWIWQDNGDGTQSPAEVECDMRFAKLPEDPAKSCQHVLARMPDAESGWYYLQDREEIAAGTDSFEVWCDMDMHPWIKSPADRGWALISVADGTDLDTPLFTDSYCATPQNEDGSWCKGKMPPYIAEATDRKVLVVDVEDVGINGEPKHWIVYSNWSVEGGTALEYLTHEVPLTIADDCEGTNLCSDTSVLDGDLIDPDLEVLDSSASIKVNEAKGPLRQFFNRGGWIVGYMEDGIEDPTTGLNRLHATRYGTTEATMQHDLRTHDQGVQVPVALGRQMIYWQ